MNLELTDAQAQALLRALFIAETTTHEKTTRSSEANRRVGVDKRHWNAIAKQLKEKADLLSIPYDQEPGNLPR